MMPNAEFIRERLGGADAVWNKLKYGCDGIIEASAGTGKTYALQSIVLKLVSDGEHSVDVKNILLVTYTEKAAGELKDRIRAILAEAGCLKPDFDEATICTIHSFCRELLTTYAFENRVPMQMDIGGINDDLVHRAVRKTLLGGDFLARYGEGYAALMEMEGFASTDAFAARAEKELAECAKKDEPPPEPSGDDALLENLVFMAWPEFRRIKDDSAMMTFDDLVTKAYRVIETEAAKEEAGERSELLDSVRRRYRIALVDEFQDTDGKQWAIFRRLFSAKSNRLTGDDVPNPRQGFLLVVGDPKQAIYSFRGADVATYLAAKEAITCGDGTQPAQTLDETYRSSKELVSSFNAIFGAGWFDGMSEDGKRIEYRDVKYPEKNERFAQLEDFTGRGAVSLLESLPYRLPDRRDGRSGYGNTAMCLPVFMGNAAREMMRLHDLPVAYKVYDAKKQALDERRLGYGDMCVLVRGVSEAAVVKRVLAQHGIPYAHYKERGLFAAEEAEALLAFFDFLAAPGKSGNLAALLLTPLFGVSPADLEDRLASGDRAFAELVDRWQGLAAKRSWNRLFESVMNETALAHPAKGDYGYDRRWTATRQILDRLLDAKGRSALVVGEFADLLRSLRRNDKGAGEDGSLRQQESESDRVQIMTMHASKGLEFKVVFVAAGMSQFNRSAVNEAKRLFYVALTRAEHKLYLPWTKWSPHLFRGTEEHGLGSARSFLLGDGCLARGIVALFRKPMVVDDLPNGPATAKSYGRKRTGGDAASRDGTQVPTMYDIGYLKDRTMRWDSFSSLNGHGKAQGAVPESSADEDEVKIPSSKTRTLLPPGNVAGNVFHEIMETLCGNDDAAGETGFAIGNRTLDEALADGKFADIVGGAMRKNALGDQKEGGDSTARTLMRMAWNALNTPISIGGRTIFLKNVAPSDRRAEVEFAIDESTALDDDLPRVDGKPRDGVFNGSIDLLIRPDGADGPVFILDWKTNSLDSYDAKSVAEAMGAAGYPLQFKLYSLAVGKWLGKDALAGVAYLFVRGGELRGGRAGVYARAMDVALRADCRAAVLGAIAG